MHYCLPICQFVKKLNHVSSVQFSYVAFKPRSDRIFHTVVRFMTQLRKVVKTVL